MKMIPFKEIKPTGSGDPYQRRVTYISRAAKHELKLLAALNNCTMIEMLDIILVHWSSYRSKFSECDNIKELEGTNVKIR